MKGRKQIIFYIISAILLALIQEAFFNDLRIFGSKPNFTIVLLCIAAVKMNISEAIIYGLSTGLFVDIVYGRYIGLYGFLYMYMAVIIVLITSRFNYSEKLWWPLAAAPLPIFLYGIAESIIIRLLAVYAGGAEQLYAGGFSAHFTTRILPTVFYNLICLAALTAPVLRFLKRKPVGRYE